MFASSSLRVWVCVWSVWQRGPTVARLDALCVAGCLQPEATERSKMNNMTESGGRDERRRSEEKTQTYQINLSLFDAFRHFILNQFACKRSPNWNHSYEITILHLTRQKYFPGLKEKLHLNFMMPKYSRIYCTAQRERWRGSERATRTAGERRSFTNGWASHVGSSRHSGHLCALYEQDPPTSLLHGNSLHPCAHTH